MTSRKLRDAAFLNAKACGGERGASWFGGSKPKGFTMVEETSMNQPKDLESQVLTHDYLLIMFCLFNMWIYQEKNRHPLKQSKWWFKPHTETKHKPTKGSHQQTNNIGFSMCHQHKYAFDQSKSEFKQAWVLPTMKWHQTSSNCIPKCPELFKVGISLGVHTTKAAVVLTVVPSTAMVSKGAGSYNSSIDNSLMDIWNTHVTWVIWEYPTYMSINN
jgi:hypothetical protein